MQNVKLNLIPGSVMPVVNVSQYDKARQFSLTVYEGASTYSLTGKDVQIRGTKPDGNGFAYDSTDGVVSVSGSTVTISTTQQMTAVGGQTMAELRITSDDTILGTLNFILMVEPSALSDDTPISDTEIPAIERDFKVALAEAEADALIAEGYAKGTQEGVPAQSGEPYYQDNAKYYKEQAEAAASGGGADALKAEGYAVGTQNGVPVTSGSPYYHNNAAYYEGEASTSATNAATSETNAGLSETAAGNSATSAAADALKSEGWAVGKQNGTPVTSGSPYYQNNAEYYKDQAAQYAAGGLIFKGSVAFASIPTTGMVNGDEYNITDDFTTDNRFIEGSGISVKAGTNIAWIGGSTNKWDLLATGGGGASTLDDLSDVTLTTPASGQILEYDGSKWANANLPTVPSDLDDLSDVTLSSPTSGQFLKFDGSKWVNGTGGGGADALDDLTDVELTSPADGDLLQRDGNGKWVNSAKIPQKIAGLQKTGCVNTLETTMIDHVVSGITFTITKDGISSVGTNASSQYDVGELVGNYAPPVSGTYKLLGCPSGGSTTTYWLEIIDDTAGRNIGSDTGNGLIVTLDATHSYRVRIKIGKSLPAPSGMWKPMVTPDLSATYDDYQPYAMTNRELTEAVTPVDYDISSAFDSTVVDTIYYANITRVGKIAIARCAIKLKTNISATTKIATLPSGLRPITTINTIFVDDGTQKWGRIALNTSNYNPAGAVYIVPISGNLTSSSTALFTVTYVAE